MYLEQGLAIGAYTASSLGIIYFNKWVFNVGFQYPIFISWSQQVGGLILYYLLAAIKSRCHMPALSQFHLVLPNIYTLFRVFPQIFTFTMMVALANYCLQVIQISTYQVARSSCLIFGIILSKLIINQIPSHLGLIGCVLIIFGVIVGSMDDTTLSLHGLLLGSLSSFFQALNQVLVHRNMGEFQEDKGLLLMYNLWGSAFTMLPVIWCFGEQVAFSQITFDINSEDFNTQWLCLFGSGVFCIAINLTTFLCISLTSPVTMSVIGFVKSILQSLGSIVFLGDIVTLTSISSLMISLMGSGVYSYGQIKSKISEPKDLEQLEGEHDMELGERGLSMPGDVASRDTQFMSREEA